MKKPLISTLFQNLDDFRQLPAYQLERRADIFFSLYLAEALSAKTGEKIKPEFIPEFPVRKGTIDQESPSNQSIKIDYICFTEDLTKAYLVELKTDQRSVNEEQLNYLQATKNASMFLLVEGIQKIFKATKEKKKYVSLFKLLEQIGLIHFVDELEKLSSQALLRDIEKIITDIVPPWDVDELFIVYISPYKIEDKRIDYCIDFKEFNKTVSKHNDELSKRFAESLEEWAKPVNASQNWKIFWFINLLNPPSFVNNINS